MRSCLRPLEGHGEPKRNPYEGGEPSLAGGPSRGDSCWPGLHLRADTTDHVPRGRKFRFPAQSLAHRLKFRLAPFFFSCTPSLLYVFVLFFSGGEMSWQRCTLTHAILARRRNSPAKNGEKVTTTASVQKRPRRCRNGCGHVPRNPVAPNPSMVSKIGGKTGVSMFRST
jgi:hypothetical protein